MANWRYFQATGQVGGTTSLRYVDSFNGDDANAGTYLLPKKSIQGALDVLSGANPTMVLAGYFNEGDFLNRRSALRMFSEGYVTIDGSGFINFNASNTSGILINNIYNFGTIEFKFYTKVVLATGSLGFHGFVKSIIVRDCNTVDIGTSTASITNITNSLFINTELMATSYASSVERFIESNTFISTYINLPFTTSQSIYFRNNYINTTSRTNFGTVNFGTNLKYNNNLVQGTFAGSEKIRIQNVWYADTEALQAATSYASNDLPSTTDPLLNAVNSFDYTLQSTSPLARGGYDKSPIGAFSVAKAVTMGDATWTLSGIDVTANVATLTGSPTGTMTSNLVQISDKARKVTRINLPDFEIAPSLGETIGRLASSRTPYAISLEIQYSTGGVTTNGTWLQVPIGTQIYHDTTADVGNDDEDFNIVNGQFIFATHLQYRITLRDNETPI
jgi:hypothetical protein